MIIYKLNQVKRFSLQIFQNICKIMVIILKQDENRNEHITIQVPYIILTEKYII